MEHEHKKQLLKDTTYYSIANYIAQGFGIVNSVALRRFLGPAGMGIWSLLQIILGYCGYASFGTTKAMARNYPILRGKGENESAEKLKDMVFTFTMTMSLIPIVILVCYLAIKGKTLDRPVSIGIASLSGFLLIQRFYDLLLNLLRSDKKFVLLSHLIIVNAVAGLIMTFALVRWWNIYGLMAGTTVVTAICIGMIYRSHPYHFARYWNSKALWQELKLGVPLVLATFLGEFLKSADDWIIARYLGFASLGMYTLGSMATQYVYSLPNMFSHVWYPNMQQDYGRKGGTPEGIKSYLLTPVFGFSILCPFLAGMAIFGITLLAQVFLPKYLPGLPAMKIYLIGTFFLLIGSFAYSYLIAIDKYLVNIPVVIAALGINFTLNVFFVKIGWGLIGVAIGTVISFFIYGFGLYVLAIQKIMTLNEMLVKITEMLGLVAYSFTAIFLIDRFVSGSNVYWAAFGKGFIFLVVSSPLLFLFEQKTKTLSHLIEMFQQFRGKVAA